MDKYKIPEGSLISFFSNKVKKTGGINFAQGIPGYKPPKELLNILKSLIDKDIHQYAPGLGNHKLLELIANSFKNGKIQTNQTLIVQGATEAIALIYIYLSQQKKDFSVLSFDPVYESYNNLPKIFNHQFYAFELSNESKIDFSRLENTIRKKSIDLILISSPGNPYGKVYSKEEMQELVKLAEKYNFHILFDAVYKDLYFEEKPFNPLELGTDKLFYVDSFSKMLSITGWRIGYLIAPALHIKNIIAIHDYIGLCAPSILQEAIAKYLDKNNYGIVYLNNLRNELSHSYTAMSKALEQLNFELPEAKGGYFVWAKLPDRYQDGFKFAIDLYEQEKVATIPGIHFSERGKSFIRFNIAREQNEVEDGIERIKRFVLT